MLGDREMWGAERNTDRPMKAEERKGGEIRHLALAVVVMELPDRGSQKTGLTRRVGLAEHNRV